ncbi:MAG: amidohydrolase [Isosphaeraceae bacterium]
MADWREEIDACIDSMANDLQATRRYLHTHPEPSKEEYRTTEFLAAQLHAVGLPTTIAPSRRGLIAGPEVDPSTPKVALRADIDALRVNDLKEISYRSTVEGVMHACGHDAHAAMAMGASLALWRCREQLPWPVPWRTIFQPAEEVGEGAAEMIAAGAAEGVRAFVALHVDPHLPVGQIAQRTGIMTAFCHELRVTIRGIGGHAARPHQSTDPIAVAVQLVGAVYQSLPRSLDSREAAVVTFGMIRGGNSPNVIPDKVELLGTVRTLSKEAALQLEARLRRIGGGLAEATGAGIEMLLQPGVSAVINDPAVTEVCRVAAAEVVGIDRVVPIPLPSMGGEDFAGYLHHAPGCLLRLGAALEDRSTQVLHSPYFDIDERALIIGAKVLARSAVLLASA